VTKVDLQFEIDISHNILNDFVIVNFFVVPGSSVINVKYVRFIGRLVRLTPVKGME